MSLEFALDKYPVNFRLRDGTECVVRPLQRQDEARLRKFFEAVPEGGTIVH
jgi:hypothetical protein